MRSCARFIFEAATISIAFVILRVLCTLLILLRISLDPAIALVFRRLAQSCCASRLLRWCSPKRSPYVFVLSRAWLRAASHTGLLATLFAQPASAFGRHV